MIVVWLVLLAAGCAVTGYAVSGRGIGIYQNPNLHEGRWGRPKVQGSGDQLRIVWVVEHVDARKASNLAHVHRAMVCVIGPGMAHLDECSCGKTRSGVYGPWS